MMRNLFVSLAAAALLVPVAHAASPGDRVEGTITEVELHDAPRHVTVRSGGEEVQVRIGARTSVDFGGNTSFSPELSSLKPGMEVKTTFTGDDPTARILVVSVGKENQDKATSASEGWGADRQEMKVRLISIDRTRGEFQAEYAGKTKSFVAEDPKMLARYDEGDLVIVKTRDAAGRDRVITDIHSAALFGRIVEVDRPRGQVRVLVDGREESFKVDRLKSLKIDKGDRISFEVEERPTGERVIVKIDERN